MIASLLIEPSRCDSWLERRGAATVGEPDGEDLDELPITVEAVVDVPSRVQKEAPDLGASTPNDDPDLRVGPQQITGVQDLVQQRVVREKAVLGDQRSSASSTIR
jgi:hypothetical protein